MGILHNLTGWHALILLAVVLLFFGASKLPALARSVGQSVRILKTEVKDGSAGTANDAGISPDTGSRPRAGGPSTVPPVPPTPIHAATAPREHAPVADAR